MCIVSVPTPTSFWQRLLAPKVHLSTTKIYARVVSPGVQGLVYSMHLSTKREVAMVLPLPVRPMAGENAVRFIDLSAHAGFFDELEALFEAPLVATLDLARTPQALLRQPLTVHEVGSFIASYVPTRFDFDRLDRKFQMPRIVVDAIPRYKDYGFAVFQLEPGDVTVHPMAFTFPTRELEKLYFPTVHVHDGTYRDRADFDHALYYQHPRVLVQGGAFHGDATSHSIPHRDYAGLVDKQRPMVKRELRGKLPNDDTWITTGRPSSIGV